ncbi:hypothetical protein CXP35_04435 [Komagataeibacter xylinus]|nr:hypothetical protein CXP35_04435 [Komagataeibacter xylinus]
MAQAGCCAWLVKPVWAEGGLQARSLLKTLPFRNCLKSQPGKHPAIIRKFLAKLFSESCEERRLLEKRRHPKLLSFLTMSCFQTVS